MKDVTPSNASEMLANVETYDHREGGLSFVGYVCIKDPCRDEVKPSIQACKTAGIGVIMITGDAKETAIAIAQELDILTPNQDLKKCCFTGTEF